MPAIPLSVSLRSNVRYATYDDSMMLMSSSVRESKPSGVPPWARYRPYARRSVVLGFSSPLATPSSNSLSPYWGSPLPVRAPKGRRPPRLSS